MMDQDAERIYFLQAAHYNANGVLTQKAGLRKNILCLQRIYVNGARVAEHAEMYVLMAQLSSMKMESKV